MRQILTFVLTCLLAAAPLAAGAGELVTIRVKGTTIDLLPKAINLMASDPKQMAERFVAKGGTRDKGDPHSVFYKEVLYMAERLVAKGGTINKGIPHSVFYKEVLYIAQQPDSWKTRGKHSFKDGDVVYFYHSESSAEKATFVKKYKLKVHDTLVEREGSAPTLYAASPGYYVIVLVKATGYTCPMHPRIQQEKEGKCGLDSMDLIPFTVYK